MNNRLKQTVNWAVLAEAANYNARLLAANCGISHRQLQRLILQSTSKSAQKWLNELRLSKAALLILRGQSVKEVAHELSYKQRSHFSRAYKSFHGVPPSSPQSQATEQMSL
jgi:AraC-like DNA-binding protein